MLRAFVEEMGYEYEDPLMGAAGDADGGVEFDNTALMAANEAIVWTFREEEEEEDDDYSDA